MRFLILFAAAVAAEVASLVIAGRMFGGWTFVALLADLVLGIAVLSGRGLAIAREAVQAVSGGVSPTGAIVDGALVVAAGLLLITPGFASDAVALVLLVPPLRGLLARRLIARGRASLEARGVIIDASVGAGGVGPDGVIDVDGTEVRVEPRPPARPRLPN